MRVLSSIAVKTNSAEAAPHCLNKIHPEQRRDGGLWLNTRLSTGRIEYSFDEPLLRIVL